jgi:anti-sigma B factor antagonist
MTELERDLSRVDDRGIRPPRAYAVARRDAPAGVVLLELAGELDLAAVPALRGRLDAAREEAARAVVIDLGAVTFVDSSALRELLHADERLRADGAQLVLAALPPALSRLVDLTGVGGALTLAPTVEQALERVAA